MIIGLALPNSTTIDIKMPLIREYQAAITWKKCKKYGDRNTGISLLIADNQLLECDITCSYVTKQIILIVMLLVH
jgi:hypothetical protein